MATQKQRRRREKEKRHEYDLVEIDEEGNETVIKATELREAAGPPARVRSSSSKKAAPQSSGGRRGEPKPASWSRVFKRAAIFAPIFFVVLLLIGGKRMTVAGALIQVVILMIFFVPFSYFMDRFMWNSHQKRLAKQRGGR